MNLSSLYQAKLHNVLEKLSNNDAVEYDDAWVEDAGEMFKAALRKQLTPREKGFRLRMSNIGRPLCQLQRENLGLERERMPYNHIVRMMLGDATECIMEVLLRVAKLPITGGKSQATLKFDDVVVSGENDIELDGRVYDTKSSSPWAYENKWKAGYAGLVREDAFGYGAQLYGYSKGTKQEQGGWIVVNKSSGETLFVEADPSPQQVEDLEMDIIKTVQAVSTNADLVQCFEPTVEYFRTKPTGNKRLHTTCTFCAYKKSCFPNAVQKPQGGSKAQNPRYYWYSEYKENAES